MKATIGGTASKDVLKKMAKEIGEAAEIDVEINDNSSKGSHPGSRISFEPTKAQITRWNR